MVFANHCRLEGKRGIAQLDRSGSYAIIANRTLYSSSKARRFALVDTMRLIVEEVYHDPNEARAAMKAMPSSS
jgi:hypothetical protein